MFNPHNKFEMDTITVPATNIMKGNAKSSMDVKILVSSHLRINGNARAYDDRSKRIVDFLLVIIDLLR